MRKVSVEEPTEIAQAAVDVAAGAVTERAPITRAEQEAVLKRFGLVNLLDLVILSALRASDRASMTVDSSYPGVRVVVRVTHPRIKKATS